MKVVGVLFFSFLQAALSTVLSVGLALPLAYFFNRFSFPGKRFFMASSVLLCLLPTKLIVFSIAHFWACSGFIGIVLAHLMLNIPLALFIMLLAYQKLDKTQLWVARNLGATAWQSFVHVELPFLSGTIVSLCALLFLLHISSFSIPMALGTAWYHFTPDVVMNQMYHAALCDGFAGLFVGRVAVCVPFLVMAVFVPGPAQNLDYRSLRVYSETYHLAQHSWWWLAYGSCIAVLTLAPMAACCVAWCAHSTRVFLKGMLAGAVDPVLKTTVYQLVMTSCVLAILSAIGSVVLACGLCLLHKLVRGRLSHLTIVFFSLLPLLLGGVGIGVLTAWWSYQVAVPALLVAVVCHVFLNYPFAYRIISAHGERYHDDMVKSAQALGASRWHALRTVIVPFIWPAVLSAWSVSFGLSLTEVGASSVLEKTLGMTIPLAMHAYRAAGKQSELMGLNLIVVGLVLGVSYALTPKK